MKIVFISDVYSPYTSGIVTSLTNFSRELVALGHDVILFTSDYGSRNINPVDGLRVIRLKTSTAMANYPDYRCISALTWREGLKVLKDLNPDIIHVHTPSFAAWLSDFFSRSLKVPLVSTYHTFLPDISGQIFPLNKISKSITTPILNGYTRAHYNRATAVIAPSEVIKQSLQGIGVSKPIHVISNGVDSRVFYPRSKEKSGPFRFLHVGRLSEEKNVDVLLHAFRSLSLTGEKSELVIVGDGPEKDRLEKLAFDLGIASQILFLGRIEHSKLPEVYCCADVFVTASTFETEGLVILEAMACGLPVIGVDKLAVPTLVQHGVSGLIAQPFSHEEFALHMESLLKKSEMRQQFAIASHQRSQEFALTQCAAMLVDVYEGLVIKRDSPAYSLSA